jgi:hypothetical protein
LTVIKSRVLPDLPRLASEDRLRLARARDQPAVKSLEF